VEFDLPAHREHTILFDGRFRATVEKGTKPLGTQIRRTGITANHLTATGLVLAGACAVAIGSGHVGVGLVLLIAAALPDMLDGAVAKASGTASPRGAFFDSVADRVSDTLVLGGVAWYLAGRDGAHAALLPFAVLGASTLISYERAKAESLGFNAKGGLMERAERIVVLCFGLLVSSLLVPVLWIMLGLTVLTAVQRFVKVWRQASAPRPEPQSKVLLSPASRWRAWRETVQARPARASRRSAAATTTTRWHERQARRRATRP
jgi:CDP-diacylglycerol--glycerol-3-phosphate 3-phosphatidyltransferase